MTCFLCIAIIFTVIGCDSDANQQIQSRITSTGVDGFLFGDSLGSVRASLGDPSGRLFFSIYQGFTWSDSFFVVTTGPLEFQSPIEGFAMDNGYSGSYQGVGIGSSYAQMVASLGEPDTVILEYFEIFCLEQNYLQFGIAADTVRNIFYGKRIPHAGETPQCDD